MLNDADLSDEMKAKIMEKMSGKSQYEELLDELSDNERRLAKRNDHFYKIKFKNIGGLVMPLIIEMTFEDGSTDVVRIPVEIWRFNRPEVSKVFKTEKKVVSLHWIHLEKLLIHSETIIIGHQRMSQLYLISISMIAHHGMVDQIQCRELNKAIPSNIRTINNV